ncbi:MAG: hypothetical protein DHS20C14_08000 [Phycisphaeraceae bacterium]|nr:MAG: hypothetical protein DHS20C14_08000 [Phycisphaeraceae bacterium]
MIEQVAVSLSIALSAPADAGEMPSMIPWSPPIARVDDDLRYFDTWMEANVPEIERYREAVRPVGAVYPIQVYARDQFGEFFDGVIEFAPRMVLAGQRESSLTCICTYACWPVIDGTELVLLESGSTLDSAAELTMTLPSSQSTPFGG